MSRFGIHKRGSSVAQWTANDKNGVLWLDLQLTRSGLFQDEMARSVSVYIAGVVLKYASTGNTGQ